MVNESRWFSLLIHRTYRGKTPTLPDAKIRHSQHPVLSFYVYTHFCSGSHWRAWGTWRSTTHASHLRNGQGATCGRSPLHWHCGLIMSMWCWVLHCADLFLIVLQLCLSYYNLFVCFNQFFRKAQFSHWVVSNSLQPHGLQHARLLHPSPTTRACSNSCP